MVEHDQITEMKLADPFADFRRQAESAFRFLVSEYDFRMLGESRAGHEITLRYQKGEFFITIFYEWGGAPGVGVGKSALGDVAAPHALGISLERLLRERAPKMKFKVKLDKSSWPQFPLDEIPALLNKYASILREHFPDMLNATKHEGGSRIDF
jgi:hypothetical protein